jgi:hypothetical protein
MFCIPVYATDTERSAYLAEAFAYYGLERVTPAYYDTTLKGRYFTDEQSGEMLDIIFETRVFDPGVYYKIGSNGTTMMSRINNIIATGDNTFSSTYSSFEQGMRTMIMNVNEGFDAFR